MHGMEVLIHPELTGQSQEAGVSMLLSRRVARMKLRLQTSIVLGSLFD